jgi:hypothetical protein
VPASGLASGKPFAAAAAVGVGDAVAFTEAVAVAEADGTAVAFASGVATGWITVGGASITVAEARCAGVATGVAVGTGVTLGCV